MNAFPFAALMLFIVDLLVIYGLVAYGGRERSAGVTAPEGAVAARTQRAPAGIGPAGDRLRPQPAPDEEEAG